MPRRLKRFLFRLCAVTAAAICAVLLIESVRSFHRSDTAGGTPLTFVTHRGALYIVPNVGPVHVESQPVTAAAPWPVTLLPVPLGAWNESEVLGFNAWADDSSVLLKCPIWFAVLLLALLAVCCYRRSAEILPRTHYLQCPSCGHLLVGVVHWRCPECGCATQSRVIEALAPRPPRPPRAGHPRPQRAGLPPKPAIVSPTAGRSRSRPARVA